MRILIVNIFFLIVFSSAWTGAAGAEKKTISRTEDPVVITGEKLKGLPGAGSAELSLMAYSAGCFKSIPFQIDERLDNGEYAFQSGPKASRDSNPGLDSNDELVFMVNDLGDRAAPDVLPENASAGVEIEVTDPLVGSKGWAYLFRFPSGAPCSEVDYVRFEVDEEKGHKRVHGKDPGGRSVIMGSPLGAVYPDEFRVVFPDGRIGEDILDREKIRGALKTKLHFDIDFKFDVLTKSKLVAWTDGPVRVIYRADGYLNLGFMDWGGQGYSLITYYRNALIWPMYIEIPFNINPFLNELEMKGYLDFNENVMGHWVYSESNPPPAKILLDGKTSEEEKSLDHETECTWIAGGGPMGTIINRLFFSEEWSMVKRKFYLNEDLETPMPPEDDPGEVAVGYNLVGFINVTELKALFHQHYYFLSGFEQGEERPILNILDHPVQVNVRQLDSCSQLPGPGKGLKP